MNNKHRWLIVIILIAFALRLVNLTYHSLWFDEAVSVYWANQSVSRILEVGFTLVEDRLPPLYYLTLKGWITWVGPGEFAVRSLSVFYGLLLIPVIFSITSLLFNRRVALMSAALVTLNPFLIWYAQEARMYAPAVFFSALAILAFLKICPAKNQQQTYAAPHTVTTNYLLFTSLFIIAAIAALYSHLYAGFLLPALGLWLVISYPRTWRLWMTFAVGGLIITLAYTPVLLAIWRFSAESTPGNPLGGILTRVWWLLQSFTIWKAPLADTLQMVISIITLLFVVLAYLPSKTNHPSSPSTSHKPKLPHPQWLITLLLIVPFLIANILMLRNHLAFFGERYFIIMVPWLLVLAAIGANNLTSWLPTRITLVPFLLLLIITAIPVSGQWSAAATKEAWRQSVDYLAQHATSNDGILIHPDWVRYPFQFYFKGPGQTYAAFSNVSAETPLDGPLQGVTGNHSVIWLIQSHIDSPDPNRRVEQWFAARYPLVTELYPPGISLKGYAPHYQVDRLPKNATPVDFQFKNGMRLVGYQVDPTASAVDKLFHPPSGWVHVTLYWTADHPINIDTTPFVNMVGPEGVWGANLKRPNDALKLFPPSRWSKDTPIIRHDLDVNLNPATPPGIYQITVGFANDTAPYPLTQVEIR